MERLQNARAAFPGLRKRFIRATIAALVIDTIPQISFFVKLKLANCARPGNRSGLFVARSSGRHSVGWVELIRAFTPVFAGYAKPIDSPRR
jgi:hypothetical protein